MTDKKGDHHEISPNSGHHNIRVPTALIHQVIAAGFTDPAEQAAMHRADRIYTDLQPAVLYTLAHDSEPVGPRIKVSNVPESTLKALAAFHWVRRIAIHERRRWIIGSFIGAPLLVILGAVLGAVLKAIFSG